MMIVSLLLLASSLQPSFEPTKVPVEHERVPASDMRVPVGDSVRAVTWDELQEKPTAPVTVRMACIVIRVTGVPGRCLPADRVPAGQEQVDWSALSEEDRSARAARPMPEQELERIAEKRIGTARLAPDRRGSELMVVRLFDVVIDPADARAPFDTDNALTLNDVSFSRPIDTDLLGILFPVIAVRENFGARVRMTCRIQASLDLLCKDPGTVTPVPGDAFQQTDRVVEDFRLATYQLTSTMKLAPKNRSGEDVVGRNLVITIGWHS